MLSEEVLELRRSGIGGTDAAAILGEDEYKSPLDVWLEKLKPETVKDESGIAARVGAHMEDFVAGLYVEQRPGRHIHRVPMLRHPSEAWMLGNVDRFVSTSERPPVLAPVAGVALHTVVDPMGCAVLECKRPTLRSSHMYSEDIYPTRHLVQTLWYMAVTGCRVAELAVFIGDETLYIHRIEWDDELVSFITDQCRAFWTRYCVGGAQPPVEPGQATKEALARLWPKSVGHMIAAPDAAAEWVAKYRAAIAAEKTAVELKERAQQALCGMIGEADGMFHKDFRVTWRTRPPVVIEEYTRPEYRHFDCRVAKPKTTKGRTKARKESDVQL